MKRISSFALLAALALLLAQPVGAWTSPIPLPDGGNGRLRIVGQNARNYVSDLTASNADVTTEEEFAAKTDKMANVFVALNADIVAICEVQENDEILGFIVDEMNTIAEADVFDYVRDGLVGNKNSYSGYMPLKSGYIYRKDRVEPIGSSTSPYTSATYKPRLRIQVFRELETGEKFVLSMNHFKAKSSNPDDDTEATRMENVSRLLTALGKVTEDPDILIAGDLNAYMDEAPIEALEEAGYEEQLVRFDPEAYSYIYKGTKGLLDHMLANETMENQVTDATIYHINTSGLYDYRYSDHDACVVTLCLGQSICAGEGLPLLRTGVPAQKTIENGQLLITLPDGKILNVFGQRIR